MNLFSILEEAAKRRPEDTAIVHDGREFRYSDLHRAAESLALTLRKAGVQAGDKVAVFCPSSPEYIVGFFAVLRAGAIMVPFSPALKAGEVAGLTEEMELDAICYSAQFEPLFVNWAEPALAEASLSLSESRAPLRIRLAARRGTAQSEREQLVGINAAAIRFSSGTTAKAKGIVVSHATLMARITSDYEVPPMAREDGVLWLLSMARGLPSTLGACLLGGAKLVVGDAMDPRRNLRLIREHALSRVHATPLFYRMMVTEEGVDVGALRAVKHFFSTSASLPAEVADAFQRKFGREIVQSYGLSECGRIFLNHVEDANKRGSVGMPLTGYKVKLAPSDSESSGGDVGELLVRGAGMFDAYYKPWRLREEVLEDGWFRTGDLARQDSDGYYWIVGRVKQMINVGGVKVFPYEIEEMLLSHPAVDEAMVYGVPEARFGEVPRARVKLRSGAVCTERDLMRYVNEKSSVFKALRGVEFVEEIPKTVTGKAWRRTLVA